MQNQLTSSTSMKVRFHECDPLQIVWHGNYLKYFEVARENFCEQNGFSYLDVQKYGFATPIVSSCCEHKLPLKYGDEFVVTVNFLNSAAAKLIFEYSIFKEDKLICTGETTQVFTTLNSELVLVNPPFFEEWKRKNGL